VPAQKELAPLVVRPSLLWQYKVTPLQSVMRRGQVLSFMEVESWDHMTPTEHRYLIALDIAISYTIVLVSFFMLQNYEFPGVLTAWSPYKLIFELLAAAVLKHVFREIAERFLLGPAQRIFTASSLACFVMIDLFIWSQIYQSFEDLQNETNLSITWEQKMSVLDITVGAGIINFLLGKLSVTFGMLLASAYIYEPLWRHRYMRVVQLTSRQQVVHLLEELEDIACRKADKVGDAIGERTQDGGVMFGWEIIDLPSMRNSKLKSGKRSLSWKALVPESCGVHVEDFLEVEPEPRTKSRASGGCGACCGKGESDNSDESATEQESTDEGLLEGELELVAQISPSAPVLVLLRRANMSKLCKFAVCVMDLILSVDPDLPVARQAREHEGDWEVSEASQKQG